MSRMIVKSAAAAVGIAVAGGIATVGFIYSGIFDFRATSPHLPIVTWALHQTYQSSMEKMTADIHVADDLETPQRIAAGARLYKDNCAVCHGAPGSDLSAIGTGIYPEAPFLLKATRKNHPNQVFFVAKEGIKMTGMPAFGKSWSDDALWSVAAFLHAKRGISAADYVALAAAAQ